MIDIAGQGHSRHAAAAADRHNIDAAGGGPGTLLLDCLQHRFEAYGHICSFCTYNVDFAWAGQDGEGPKGVAGMLQQLLTFTAPTLLVAGLELGLWNFGASSTQARSRACAL